MESKASRFIQQTASQILSAITEQDLAPASEVPSSSIPRTEAKLGAASYG
jgi:hypothetical protein